jgi:HEAT repeat protein
LACDRCKEEGLCNPVDYVPHLVERIERDESIRVRRMAAVMLATGRPDRRAAPVFDRILATESDRKLRKHAEWGLMRLREAGLVTRETRRAPSS